MHTVVVDAEALARLDQLFSRTGLQVPRSAPILAGSTLAPAPGDLTWHALPIAAGPLGAILSMRTTPEDTFNDCLRRMLELAPLTHPVPVAEPRAA